MTALHKGALIAALKLYRHISDNCKVNKCEPKVARKVYRYLIVGLHVGLRLNCSVRRHTCNIFIRVFFSCGKWR